LPENNFFNVSISTLIGVYLIMHAHLNYRSVVLKYGCFNRGVRCR